MAWVVGVSQSPCSTSLESSLGHQLQKMVNPFHRRPRDDLFVFHGRSISYLFSLAKLPLGCDSHQPLLLLRAATSVTIAVAAAASERDVRDSGGWPSVASEPVGS